MDPMLQTYVLALGKQGLSKKAGWLGATGKFLAQLPLWIGGSMIGEKVLRKKPRIRRQYVPRGEFAKLVQEQRRMRLPAQRTR